LLASDDLLELALWNGVPFNDERIFQFLQGVERMMIPSNCLLTMSGERFTAACVMSVDRFGGS
jgi:hypothetical protein